MAKSKSKGTIEEKNKALNKEIKLERERPEKIVEDIVEKDEESKKTIKDFEPKSVEKGSNMLLLISLLVVAGFIGLFFASKFIFKSMIEKEIYDYNGFTFSYDKNAEVWFTAFKMNDKIYPLPFHYSPRDVKHIPIDINTSKITSYDFIYLVMPPMDTVEVGIGRKVGIAAVEVGKVLGTKNDIFNIPAKAAVSVVPNDLSEGSVPVITCADANESVGVIMFQFGSFPAVYEKVDNCYHIQGTDGEDIVRSSDRFVFELLGIMKTRVSQS